MAAQLIPVPAPLLDRLSPHARDVWQALSLSGLAGALPLTVDMWSTVWALGVYSGLLLIFFVCQVLFASGGVRTVVRGMASTGLLLSAEALAQDATAHGLVYWRRPPPIPVAPPFGPFFNRDHFATWVVMAVPACVGYLLAHAAAHHESAPSSTALWRQRLRRAADARSIWLAAAICLMLVGLVASFSRAGMAGLMAALALGFFLRRRRPVGTLSGWTIAAIVAAALVALSRVDLPGLFSRISGTGAAVSRRMEIWQATLPVLRDFWLTGSGSGTYETVMLVYRREPSLFRINAAHNHYLQMLTEGGLVMAVPVAIAAWLYVKAAAAALDGDRSRLYLMRVGALCGLAGAAVQSVWETGWLTPANGILAAVLAAIVIHDSPRHHSRSTA
jgi:hypothetical protein